jgi:hypothetical protein
MKTALTILAVLLYGEALAASVTVAWTPNAEADLAGYRLSYGYIGCAALGPMQPLVSLGKVATYAMTVPDTTTVLSARIAAVDTSGNVSAQSACVEKAWPTASLDDDSALQAQLDALAARVTAAEGKLAALKGGLCKLTGSSVTKDVLAERAALGGCP